jgi:hypothetical protein
VAALTQGSKNTHQYSLAIRTLLASIAITVLPQDYSRANQSLTMIIVKRCSITFQKRE